MSSVAETVLQASKSSVFYSGQNFFTVKLDHALLIFLAGMNVDDGCPAVE
jgi:hypothetical protein